MSKVKKAKKIYHYAPISPAFILCDLRNYAYYYTNVKKEVSCPDCLKKLKEKSK